MKSAGSATGHRTALATVLLATASLALFTTSATGAAVHSTHSSERVVLQNRTAAKWPEIYGNIVAASSSALLLNDVKGSGTDGYAVLKTKGYGSFATDITVPGSSEVQCPGFIPCLSGVVTDPSPSHAAGLALFVTIMLKPASGLNPERAITYMQNYDVATGTASHPVPAPQLPSTVVQTSAEVPGGFNALYGQGDVLTLYDQYQILNTSTSVSRLFRVNTATGQVLNHVNLPEGTGVSSIGGYLVAVENASCATVIYNAATLAKTGQNDTCDSVESLSTTQGGGGADPIVTKSLSDGYYVGLNDESEAAEVTTSFRLATGQPTAVNMNLSGPRSTTAANWLLPVNTYVHRATGNALSTDTLGSWAKEYFVSDAR
jgi:hypothetical protein